MSATLCAVRRRTYVDSILLMRTADALGHAPGVTSAAALMATEANKRTLREAGFDGAEIDAAAADDLVVGVHADSDADATAALSRLDALLSPEPGATACTAASFDAAVALQPDANVAVISVPGEHAAAQMREAIEHGLHIFCFSSNVPLADEVALKRQAAARGLLVMGPDCGTAIIGGRGLGFANAVRPGSIGVAGGSGTGMQAITSLIHEAGSGISAALGTGSRDAGDDVGGISTRMAVAALLDDPQTEVVVLVTKAPGPATGAELARIAQNASKPVVLCFLGEVHAGGTVTTLEDAARRALDLVGCSSAVNNDASVRVARRPGRIVGLFAGGSLLQEARSVLAAQHVVSSACELTDMGSEQRTRGRPHPMIDSGPRIAEILRAGDDPGVAVLLLDVVLGFGAAADPAGDLAPAIRQAGDAAHQRGQELVVLASVIGTADDPQDRARQEAVLRDAGAIVLPTSARAARAAAEVIA
jgi:FdrA protein